MMENAHEDRALSSIAGVFALALWSVYILLSLASMPDVPYRMMVNSFFGLFACVAVLANFRNWWLPVLLACGVYVVVYGVQIIRMTGMMAGGETPFFSALCLYYGASWTVANVTFIERGAWGGLVHVFFEYAMPVLVVALILLTVLSRRTSTADT